MGLDSSRCQHRDPAIDFQGATTIVCGLAKLGARSANLAQSFVFLPLRRRSVVTRSDERHTILQSPCQACQHPEKYLQPVEFTSELFFGAVQEKNREQNQILINRCFPFGFAFWTLCAKAH